MRVFVDRDEELETLIGYINNKLDVIIYGLRGIGKTSLLEELADRLRSEGRSVISINGYEIASPQDVAILVGSEAQDPRILLSELFMKDQTVIIIDEFMAFLRVFVGRRALPSIKRAAMFLRALIEKKKEERRRICDPL